MGFQRGRLPGSGWHVELTGIEGKTETGMYVTRFHSVCLPYICGAMG